MGRFRQFVSGVERRGGLHAAGGLGQAHAPERRPGAREQRRARGPTSRAGSTRGRHATSRRRTRTSRASSPSYATWTTTAGSQENLPINCVNWYEAYAFCIWDGGFLPSEAEWEYAAAGGSQQREYPWGSTAPGTANQYAIYGCYYPSGSGDAAPAWRTSRRWERRRWAGASGASSIWRATSGSGTSTGTRRTRPCTDCANLTPGVSRTFRGGYFSDDTSYLSPSARREFNPPSSRANNIGFRCARTP